MTSADPIVAEVRKAREEFAERFGGDLRAMAADTRRREAGARTVDRSRSNGSAQLEAEGESQKTHEKAPTRPGGSR